MWRVGVDAGGTFTDVCLMTGAEVRVWKVASTPDDPSLAITAGVLEALSSAGASPADVEYFGHGTTVATNALIQNRGAPTGLVTTEGFRDLLEIGRQRRPHLYDLQVDKPPCLVPRALRLEVRERVRHDGRIEQPLDPAQVRGAIHALRAAGVRSVAVCFLYAYVDPRHEQAVRRLIEEEFPGAFVSCSHEVAPEFREYERLSTVVVNASLGPVMDGYLARLGPRLAEAEIRVPPHVTQSNGGVMSFETARALPVRAVLSGPATGVVGALHVGRVAGFRDLITLDMGGTSTDVSLSEDGRPRLAAEIDVHGHPLKTPALDIHTVGAGGGSIAFVDAGGLLKVGPRSAGAVPGPVCYGIGNEEPTVTDANVVLQTLNPKHLLGGRMPIDRGQADTAIARLAGQLGNATTPRGSSTMPLDAMTTAQGILSVVTATMARAIRVISVQRGHDPREYTLVAFGGAGPLHAARLARELEIPRVLVPRHPGILCALGLLLSDLTTNYAQTRLMLLAPEYLERMLETFESLERQASAWFEREGVRPEARTLRRTVDMRYAGQNYELAVAFPEADDGPALLAALKVRFERAHEQVYGYVASDEPIQVVTLRLEAAAAVRHARGTSSDPGSARSIDAASRVGPARRPGAWPDAAAALVERREVWLPEARDFVQCPVYDREKLVPGDRISGPAIVEQMDATTLVLPDQRTTVDPGLNLLIEG
jgi:N-methylhydantoinase A